MRGWTQAERLETAAGCEHAARVCWRNASDPDHSWDAETNLRAAERLAEAARMLRDHVEPALHFVGFRGEEYWSAVRVWGKPGFIHMGADPRMRREVADGDTIIYANGWEARRAERNFSDTTERLPA